MINEKFNLNANVKLVEYTDKEAVRDGYYSFEDKVKERFKNAVSSGKKLFKTNAEDVFETFLQYLPAEARQHYNCNACRSFYNKYGGLVVIEEDGRFFSPLWNAEDVPEFFKPAVKSLEFIVLNSTVNGVFISEDQVLGHPVTGEWTHIHAHLPVSMVHKSRISTAGQEMAKKREEFGMVNRAIQEFTFETVEKALALIDSEALYRGDKARPNIVWFKELVEKIGTTPHTFRRNLVWLAVANAPTGFANIRSNAAGTLLKNISEGLPMAEVAAKFEQIMNPAFYQRSQSAPSENSIYEAEKIVENLGIADSLARRYATIDEIPVLAWKPTGKEQVESKSTGVFGHLKAQAKENVALLPSSVMTWEKFRRTVLPTADSMEVKVDDPSRFMALVTAVNPESENILQWNNPFSWYYHGGVDSEIKRRVEEAGGRYEDNEIRVSLIWEGFTDLDLHCVTPRGNHIYYSDKRDVFSGGFLDLDMNGLDMKSSTPVENMRWASNAPEGRYKFYVHNYNERGLSGTPYRVEMEINGKIYHYEGKALRGGEKQVVFEFDYVKGYHPIISSNSKPASGLGDWGVESDSFVKVNAVTVSPNLWGETPITHAGNHIFFLLDGVKDEAEGAGRGFFNEMLQPELRQIRKTLELYTKNTPIEGQECANANGVGYSKDQEWNLTVKVTSGNAVRIIKIDRWD